MNWYTPYQSRLAYIYPFIEQEAASMPAPMCEQAMQYILKFNPLDPHANQNYICQLLPSWMSEISSLSEEQYDKLTIANIYGMLYFYILDDVMDNPHEGSEIKVLLATGSLFQSAMQRVWRELFHDNQLIWEAFEQYNLLWASCVSNEGSSNYFMNSPQRIADKAAPVKMASTAVLLLSDRMHDISQFELAIDTVLMSLQMADDWIDRYIDYEQGNYNSLNAMIASYLPADTQLQISTIDSAIYTEGKLQSYVAIVQSNHVILEGMDQLPPSLINFHNYIVQKLTEVANEIDKERFLLREQGAFGTFLAALSDKTTQTSK